MAAPRFFVPAFDEGVVALSAEESRHARRVLRLRAGDLIELFDGSGRSAAGEIMPDGGARSGPVTVRVARVTDEGAPASRLTLLVAPCKGPRLTMLIEKLTELGVDEMILTRFERSVVRLKPESAEKLMRTAIEACKQCGRNRAPIIRAGRDWTRDLANWRDSAGGAAQLFVADPGPSATPVEPGRDVAVVIGPEGGFTDAERAALIAQGAVPLRLARNILRVETAAIAAAAKFADFS